MSDYNLRVEAINWDEGIAVLSDGAVVDLEFPEGCSRDGIAAVAPLTNGLFQVIDRRNFEALRPN